MKKIFFWPLVVAVAGLLFCTACKKEKTEEDSKKGEVINNEDPTNIVYNDTIIDITDQIPCKIKMPDSAFLVNSNIFDITRTPDSVLLINNQSQLQQFCDNQPITIDLTHYSMLVFSGTSSSSFYDITPTLTYNNDKKKYELIIYIKHGIVMLAIEVKWKRYYLISPKINSISDMDIVINYIE
ncbi:MAG: hypothetical protein J5606_02380 [Bacteroidales bacterium]|nr:hypothetical protein [Bacteroidales bacterium]